MEGRQHLAYLLQLIGLASAADCPVRAEARALALEAIEEADKQASRERLDTLVRAYSCTDVATADEVAEMFLLEGALASYDKDAEVLAEAFQSAAAVSENFWVSSLGPVLQDRFVTARAALLDSGEIAFDPEPTGYVVFVDGRERTRFPVQVNEGLHLIQIGRSDREILFAHVVSLNARSQVVVNHDLSPAGTAVVPIEEPRPDTPSSLALHVGVGVGVGFGEALAGATAAGDKEEPASKIVVPLELGVMGTAQSFWWRGAASVAPVLGGSLLYASDGVGHGSKVVGGGHVAGGLLLGRAHFGVLTGPSWPGRWQGRAVVGGQVVGPLRLEGRLGVNAVTARAVEPALEVMIAVTPKF